MIRWIRALGGALLGLAALAAHGQACNVTVNPGADISATSAGMPAGQVLCLNAGTYTGNTVAFPSNGGFAIGNGVIIKGMGATPADVKLTAATSTVDHTVYFLNYVGGKTPNGAQMINLTIQGGGGGVQIYDFFAPGTRITDVKFKDVVITTLNTNAAGFGFLARNADRVVLDNVTITSNQTAINFIDTTDSLVMNSTVTKTVAANAAALSVQGGSANRFVNNSFGQPQTTAGVYSFTGGGIVFYNTSDNRFEGNTLQGMRDDALDFTITDLSSLGIPLQKSLNNYVGKNQIIHKAFALEGKTLGSSGIWSNCSSDGSWIYGNTTTGAAECGICSWGSKSNMVQGNVNYNNGIAGIFVSGGQEALDNCTPAGSTAFQQKPVATYLQSNANFYNRNDEVVVRDADQTDITRNYSSARNGLGGAFQSCTNPACQSSFSLESDGVAGATSSFFRVLANTSVDTTRGIWVDNPVTSISDFYLNRTINATNTRISTNSTKNVDYGSILGGNFWSNFVPSGNPSATPYTGVLDSTSNTTGKIVDRFPYQSSNLGRGYNITFFEPRAGSSFAQGSLRTVRWVSDGCVWVDLEMAGLTLLTAHPNTGYAVVTIPTNAPIGNTNIVAKCRDASGAIQSQTNSPTFAVSSASLQLLSPGRDDVFNTSQQVWVSWKNTAPGTLTSVSIDYSADGGSTWPTVLATMANQNTNPVTSTRVTLPATASGTAMIRVRSGTSIDQMDGYFSLRGAAGNFTNVPVGRTFVLGHPERLEWSSPQNSRFVTINATVGAVTRNVATDLPDRGSFDWIPADMGPGSMSLSITYKNQSGATLSTVNSAAVFNSRYPTTITFGAAPTIGPGQSTAVSVSTNSGVGVSLSASPSSVCTVTGTTVNGVANGTCTLTANAAASGNFAAALPATLQFAVGNSQTITFDPPDYVAVSSSITLSATASSGLAVTFSSLTPGVCSISGGNVLTGNTVGDCIVAADQSGNGTYGAAAQVQRTIKAVAASNIPRLVNISTRMQVLTGSDVMIAGFIIGGSQPKTIVIRARGPSMAALGVPGTLQDPVLQLFQGQTQLAVNDNWQQAANAATLQASGFAPSDAREAAIYVTLAPGAYTGIVTGSGGTTGVGLVEVFEVDHPEIPLINIATRGQVQTGSNVMIAGFIIQGQDPQTVVVRARGPSMAAQGVPGLLANPKLELYAGQALIGSNDDWQTASNAAAIQSAGFAPSDPNESAIMVTLQPGAYSTIVSGVNNTTGVAIVEVFGL